MGVIYFLSFVVFSTLFKLLISKKRIPKKPYEIMLSSKTFEFWFVAETYLFFLMLCLNSTVRLAGY